MQRRRIQTRHTRPLRMRNRRIWNRHIRSLCIQNRYMRIRYIRNQHMQSLRVRQYTKQKTWNKIRKPDIQLSPRRNIRPERRRRRLMKPVRDEQSVRHGRITIIISPRNMTGRSAWWYRKGIL